MDKDFQPRGTDVVPAEAIILNELPAGDERPVFDALIAHGGTWRSAGYSALQMAHLAQETAGTTFVAARHAANLLGLAADIENGLRIDPPRGGAH